MPVSPDFAPRRHAASRFRAGKVRAVDLRIGLGMAFDKERATAGRDDIIVIAWSLAQGR